MQGTWLKDTLQSNLCWAILVKENCMIYYETKKVLDMKMLCLPNPDMLVYVYIHISVYICIYSVCMHICTHP